MIRLIVITARSFGPVLTTAALFALAGRAPAGPAADAAAGGVRIPDGFEVHRFLSATEARVRPQVVVEDGFRLGRELQERGFPQAAQSVFDSIRTSPADLAELTKRSISLRHYPAADELLGRWTSQSPLDPGIQQLRAVIHYAEGQNELAFRDLQSAIRGSDLFLRRAESFFRGGQPAAAFEQLDHLREAVEDPFVRLLLRLLVLQQCGLVPGLEVNPWGIRFHGPVGAVEIGRIEPAEAAKLGPDDFFSFLELVALLPTKGNLWSLLGELFNAAGDTSAALQCYNRAEILLDNSPRLSQRVRALEEYESNRLQSRQQAIFADPDPPAAPESKSNPPVRYPFVFVIGGGVVAVLVVLQVLQWYRRARMRRP